MQQAMDILHGNTQTHPVCERLLSADIIIRYHKLIILTMAAFSKEFNYSRTNSPDDISKSAEFSAAAVRCSSERTHRCMNLPPLPTLSTPPSAPHRVCNSLLQQTQRLADGTSFAIDSNRGRSSGKTHMHGHTHKHTPVRHVGMVSPSRSDKQLRMQHSQPTHLNGTAALLASRR